MSDLKHIQENGISMAGGAGVYRFLPNEEEVKGKDLSIGKATFEGLVNYVKARKEEISKDKNIAHFQVNVREATIELRLREFGGTRHGEGPYLPPTVIMASAKFSDKYNLVREFMQTHPSAHALAMELREVPHLFSSADDHATAVGAFRNLSQTIKKILEDTSSDDGNRKKKMELQIEGDAPAVKWQWNVPIYEGGASELIGVSTLYEANESMNGVLVRLVNWTLKDIERKAVEKMIGEAINDIEAVVPGVPMVYVD